MTSGKSPENLEHVKDFGDTVHRMGLMKITKPVASKKCIALEEGRQIGREGLVAYRVTHGKVYFLN